MVVILVIAIIFVVITVIIIITAIGILAKTLPFAAKSCWGGYGLHMGSTRFEDLGSRVLVCARVCVCVFGVLVVQDQRI